MTRDYTIRFKNFGSPKNRFKSICKVLQNENVKKINKIRNIHPNFYFYVLQNMISKKHNAERLYNLVLTFIKKYMF